MKRALCGVAFVLSLGGSAVAFAQADAGAEEAAPMADASGSDVSDTGADSAAPEPEVAEQRLLPGDRTSLPSVHVTGPPECPTAEEFVAELEAGEGRLRLQPVDSGRADYEIRFRPWGGGYDAEVKDSAGRVRSLEGADCAEIARAVGLSLLVLVDAQAEQLRARPEPDWTPAGRIPEEPTDTRWRARGGAIAGLGGMLLPLPVVGAYARASGPVEISSWFVYGFGYTKNHGPGQVELSWLGLGSEVCYIFFDLFGLCGGGWVGRLAASGQGYDRNSSVARWQPGLSFSYRFRSPIGEHWEWGVNGAGLLALTEERITVANVEGDAFTTRRLTPLITLELGAHF
ncbi:MAG: hypothetical protein R3B07_29380 [Polyangiaceae bacterium]